YSATGRRADQALQLIAAMRRNRRVGVHGKALHTGAVRPREPGRLSLRAKARAEAPYLLARPLPPGEALLHRGRHGAGELGGGVAQGVIPGGHRGFHTRFQRAQPAARADDPPTDLLHHRCHSRIAGWLDREQAGFALLVGTIELDPFKVNHVAMQIAIAGTAETLDPCD